jgi:hypothetical protein
VDTAKNESAKIIGLDAFLKCTSALLLLRCRDESAFVAYDGLSMCERHCDFRDPPVPAPSAAILLSEVVHANCS